MSIIYNGTTISTLKYNNTDISKVIYNGVTVFSSIDPTKSSFTEDEFIAICNAGLQNKMNPGAIIKLDNTYQKTWEVIGVDHDNTSGTVDIMSHTPIHYSAFNNGTGSISYYYYSGSLLHDFCGTTIPNGFTNATTKALVRYMNISTNGTTITRKGKALSCTEVGYSSSVVKVEGIKYSFLTNDYGWRPILDYGIWTRSMYYISSSSYSIMIISGKKETSISNCSNKRYVLPVIRF